MKLIGLAITTLFASVVPLSIASAQQQSEYAYWHGPHMWGGTWHAWLMIPMMIVMIIIVAVVIAFVLRIFGVGNGAKDNQGSTASALAILSERFARGEINKEEYEERKRILNG